MQMMFSFMLGDDAKPLRLCKHCQKIFLDSQANSTFCSARCKNQYNVYKSRGKNKGQDGENIHFLPAKAPPRFHNPVGAFRRKADYTNENLI